MIDDTRVLSKPLAYGMLGFNLIFTVITFSLLTFTDAKPMHFSPLATHFLYVTCVLFAPVLYILGTKYTQFKLPAIILMHINLMAMLIFFNEINGPFTPLWAMIILISTLYYGWKGFIWSSATLPISTAAFLILYGPTLQPSALVYGGVAVMVNVFAIFTSYLFVRVIMNSHKKNRELESTQRSEQMQVNRLNTLLNSISDAVMTLNRYGRVTSQNAAAQAFFDTNQSLIGRDIDTLLLLKDKEGNQISAHELMGTVKSTVLRDDLSIGEGGDTQHLSIQMARIRSTFDDNEEYGVVLILRDITKQKTLEEEKDEFISVTSHELRTPVAIAEGSLSNLLVMYDKEVKPEVLKASARMSYDQIIYLAKIINDLSTLSRAERGVGDAIEEIDVTEMLRNLYDRYGREAEAKSLRLDLNIETNLPHVETSRLYLEEILQNLITNAIKYTKEGSVTINSKLLEGDRIQFSVTDTGIGIGKSDIAKIFDKFYRSEDYRTRETNGTGLGLYVVKKLADKLETKIDVDSRLNHGSTFSFSIPLRSTKLKAISKTE